MMDRLRNHGLLELVWVLALSQILNCAHVQPYRVTNYFRSPKTAALRGKPIAVLPFQNLTEIPKADWIVANEFNLQLGKTGAFTLLERMRIEEIFKEQDLDPGRIDPETAVELGKMLGAQGVVLGTVTECQPYDYERLRRDAPEAPGEVEVDVADLTFATVLLYYAVTTPDTVRMAEEEPEEVDDEERRLDWKKACIVTSIVAVVVGGCLLGHWIASRPKPARIGMSVSLVDVETGEQLWQAAETFDGGDRSVKALVPESQHRKLATDMDYLNRVLCEQLAKTLLE